MTDSGSSLDSLSVPQQRYVEVIAELAGRRGWARMTDVAEQLDVRLPSASEAVKRLVEGGLAARNSRLEVGLTDRGRRIAGQLGRRHQALRRFMVDVMAVEPGRADELACRVEHYVDRRFADRLVKLAEFLEREHPGVLEGIAAHIHGKTSAGRKRTRTGAVD